MAYTTQRKLAAFVRIAAAAWKRIAIWLASSSGQPHRSYSLLVGLDRHHV